MEISARTDDWKSVDGDFVVDVKEHEELCVIPSPGLALDLDDVVGEVCVNVFPKRVVSKESLDRLHELCIEAMDGLDIQPEDGEITALMLSLDGDSVVSADHILKGVIEQTDCPVEVGAIFRWMWSWPLNTPPDLLTELAQHQFKSLVVDDDRRSRPIQVSLSILGNAKMAVMQTAFRVSQCAGSDTCEDESADDYGDSEFQLDPD